MVPQALTNNRIAPEPAANHQDPGRSLFSLEMHRDPKQSGHLCKVTGPFQDSAPLWEWLPFPQLSSLACQGTAELPLNEKHDSHWLDPINTKLSGAAKCPASQQLRPVWQDIFE